MNVINLVTLALLLGFLILEYDLFLFSASLLSYPQLLDTCKLLIKAIKFRSYSYNCSCVMV